MKNIILISSLSILLTSSLFAQEDKSGCKDYPLFNRFPNFYITDCSENFNEMEIRTSPTQVEKKEGNLIIIEYDFNFDTGEKMKSPLQIMKNYENAIVAKGGKLIFKNTDPLQADLEAIYHAVTPEKEYWVKLANFGGNGIEVERYTLYVLEMEPMHQEITAGEMLDALQKDGFVALDIHFETGKTDILAESMPVVDQIVVLLKQQADLKVSIEGHTDNTGTEDANQLLSENRAKSVVKALLAAGIETSRLVSKGWGQTRPVADNRTEDGRAKNRRVEIVKR